MQNPFGDAKPREAVLAQRTGKDEATVVKEDASTYDIHLKLNATQFAEKKERQHEIDDLKAVLASGGGEQDPEELQVRCPYTSDSVSGTAPDCCDSQATFRPPYLSFVRRLTLPRKRQN